MKKERERERERGVSGRERRRGRDSLSYVKFYIFSKKLTRVFGINCCLLFVIIDILMFTQL